MNKIFYSKKLLIYSFFFFCLINLNAQSSRLGLELSAKHVGMSDGLVNNHINSTFIDPKENIWFLTNNKISSFTNGQIRNYEFSNAYSNKGFNHAIEDGLGNFWLMENFEWFYPFNIQRCVIFNPTNKVSIPIEKYLNIKLNLHSVKSDSERNIYFSTKNGEVYRFQHAKKRLSKILKFDQKSLKILSVGKESLIICIEKSAKFDSQILEVQKTGKVLKRHALQGKLVTSIIKLRGKTYFTYQKDQRVGIQELGGSFEKKISVSKESYLSSITFNPNKNLWVVNKGNGLEFLDENFEAHKTVNYNFLIHDVKHDQRGNTFLATNEGIYILRLVEQKIKTYLANPQPEKTSDNYSCRAILKVSDNEIVVNTNRRRQIINLKNDQIQSIGISKDLSSPDNKFMLAALKDSDGEFLFSEDVLVKTNILSKKNTILSKLDSTKIWSMAHYRNGLLLGLEKKGVIYFDNKKNFVKTYKTISEKLRNSIIYDFYVLTNENVLIASEAGLFKLVNNEKFEEIKLPNQNTEIISFFSIKSIKKDSQRLLLASGKGIWIYDIQKKTIRPFIQDLSFQRKKFLSAYQTKNGVWASSEEGVWYFSSSGVLMKILTENDGLTSKECNRLAHFQDENDILYFGGINGLNVINPKDFVNQSVPNFPLRVNNITTYANQQRNRSNLRIIENYIMLERSENSIALSLNYEDFKYDCSKKFFYRSSKSIKQDWIPIVGHILLLDYISRGQTDIEVKVVSCDNFIQTPIIKFTISRPKSIFQEWYLWVIVLILLGLLLWSINKYTTNKLRLRNESLQRKIARQTQSLQESLTLKETLLSLLVHDVRYPVQSFYDLSKKLAYLTKKNDQERLMLLGQETEEKSRKVLWLIDELVYWVKSTNDKNETIILSKNIGEQIQQILDIYTDEIAQKNLSFSKSNLDHAVTSDYGLLIIVLRNLIYNSIIHSEPSSNIEITLEKDDGKFILKIINQSVGNSRTLEGGLGIGLALLYPLLEKSNISLKTNAVESIFTAQLEIY